MDPLIVMLLVIPFAGALVCGIVPRGAKPAAAMRLIISGACCLAVSQ